MSKKVGEMGGNTLYMPSYMVRRMNDNIMFLHPYSIRRNRIELRFKI